MSRRASVILAIASLLVGFIVGGWSIDAYWTRRANQLCISTMTAEAGMTLAELKRLRAGQTTNVVQLMEMSLDGDLIGLGGFLADPDELKRNPSNLVVIQMAKDYRSQYPYKSGYPEIDAATAKAFHLVDRSKPSN